MRQIVAHALHRLEHERELFPDVRAVEPVEVAAIAHRIECRAFRLEEAHALAKCVGHHEDVGEQDRGVEAEAADGLQRHLRGERRRVDEVEKTAGLLAHLAVLGQVAAGLAHEPDRRRLRLAPLRTSTSFDVPAVVFSAVCASLS